MSAGPMSELDSDAMDKERLIVSGIKEERKASLLGGGAGWSSDSSSYRVIERSKGLFYLLTLESIGFVLAEDEDLSISDEFFGSRDFFYIFYARC